MSLEKKDVRSKISAEAHERLTTLAEFHEKDISELSSLYLEKQIFAESRALTLYQERIERLGRSGTASGDPAASPGIPGKTKLRRV